jgi:hypothetical protein
MSFLISLLAQSVLGCMYKGLWPRCCAIAALETGVTRACMGLRSGAFN